MLKVKEAPFLLSVLFGSLAFLTETVVDRVSESPIMTYEIRSHEESYKVVSFENITSKTVFRNLYIEITPEDTSIAIETEKSDVNDLNIVDQMGNYAPTIESGSISMTIAGLQPKGQVEVLIYADKQIGPLDITFKSKHNSALIVSKKNTYTFLIKNETRILLTLIVLWSISIIIYLSFLKKNQNEATS